MRISMIGQAAFGEAVFQRLTADGRHEVVGVSAPAPGGGRPDPLWAAGEAAGLPLFPTAGLRSEGEQARWAGLEADLCVMAFVTDLLPAGLFSVPKQGTIQYHPSLLPLHRGSSAMAWAIINGDEETGLTVFWPDKGIDTGPVLLQERVALAPTDTVGSIYFNHLFPRGVEAMARAVDLVASGEAPRVDQDHAHATYEPPVGDPHAEIHWYWPAASIYALIRGCNPQPGAWTTFEGEKLRIFDCELLDGQQPGMPGRVLQVGADGFDVRLNGGVLRVRRVLHGGGKKVAAGEWAAAVGLKAGARFR